MTNPHDPYAPLGHRVDLRVHNGSAWVYYDLATELPLWGEPEDREGFYLVCHGVRPVRINGVENHFYENLAYWRRSQP